MEFWQGTGWVSYSAPLGIDAPNSNLDKPNRATFAFLMRFRVAHFAFESWLLPSVYSISSLLLLHAAIERSIA
jgi:hypothetical protein